MIKSNKFDKVCLISVVSVNKKFNGEPCIEVFTRHFTLELVITILNE